MAANEFLWKPESEKDKNLVVLTPSNLPNDATVEIVDADGNVIESGGFSRSGHNDNRGHYRFSKPGAAYGDDVSVRITSGGQSNTLNIGSGGLRFDTTDIGISGGPVDPSNYATQTNEEGDIPGFTPGVVDYGTLGIPQVDYPGIVGGAYGMGDVNRGIYYQNILSPEAQAAGLSATATDIAGIQMGAQALAPMVAQAGRLDTAENIQRARALDQFNLQRYPQFSEQAREQKQQAAEATGVDYLDRMTDTLDTLQTYARGEIPETMAEDFAKYQASRSSDLASASGISSISGAGVRLADRANVMERLGMSERALAQIPGAATTAQRTLEAPTFYAQPTQVPLTQSNISQRLPVQPNISAGATQLQAGTQATQLSTISPTALAQMGINAEQWNQMNAYERDKFVLDRQQSQLAAIDQATMADMIAEQGREDYLDEREQSRWWQGIQGATGILAGLAKPTTTPTQQQPTGEQPTTGTTGATEEIPTTTSTGGYVAPTATTTQRAPASDASYQTPTEGYDDQQYATPVEGYGDEAPADPTLVEGGAGFEPQSTPASKTAVNRTKIRQIQSGGATDTPQSNQIMMKAGGGNSGSNEVLNTAVNGGQVVSAAYNNLPSMIDTVSRWMAQSGQEYFRINGNDVSSTQLSSYLSGLGNSSWFGSDPSKQPPSDYRGNKVVGTDYTNKDNPTYTLENGETVTNSQMQAYRQEQNDSPSIFQRATQGLSDYGLDWQTLGSTATTLANWDNLTNTQRAAATGQIGTTILSNNGILTSQQAAAINRNIDGLSTLLNPDATDIEKGAAIASMGVSAFTGANLISDNPTIYSGLNAISLLGSNASTEDKVAGLTGMGIDVASAYNIISQTTAGNMNAALSLINTARGWDDMDDVQRAVSVLSTGSQVLQATSSYLPTLGGSVGASAATTTGATVGATAGTTTGSTAATTGTAAGTQTAGTATAGSSLGSYANIASGVATYAGASYTAYNTWRQSKDTPRSQSGATSIISMGAAGASVGAYHGGGYGALIGLGAGLQAGIAMEVHGTGKGAGQWGRDNWRDSMESQGLVSLDGNKHNVTLADGSVYDIGIDGDAKLENKDGTFRHSFDVDWSNDAATSSIPYAHLFAMATGLDPNRSSGFDLWHRTTAQSLNAASSNADNKNGIGNNFRSMMDQAGVTPDHLIRRVETLRLENNINDQEYGVYLNSINEMYGTNYTPSNRADAIDAAIKEIEAIPEKDRPKEIKEFYETITNDRKLRLNQRDTNKRTGKDQEEVWQIAGYSAPADVPSGISNWEMEQIIAREEAVPTIEEYRPSRFSSSGLSFGQLEDLGGSSG